ncbi:MAG: DUF6265 family protein [Pyrinomonadaceae bacterium]
MRTTKLTNVLVAIALTSVLMPGNTIGQSPITPSPFPMRTISELGWISGSWQTASGGRAQIEEHWTQPAGDSMLGMSRTVAGVRAGVRTVEFEYLRLEQRKDGIYYVAHPKARCPGTAFKLTRLATNEAVFENPLHDFPKRVIYRKTPEGLVASIDAGEGTRSQSFSYLPMKK